MLIGISGHKQSGKNTVALIWQLLVFEASPRYKEIVGTKYVNEVDYVMACLTGKEEYKLYSHYFTWEQHSFAHKLKQVVCALTGCTMSQLEQEWFKNSTLPKAFLKSKLDISTYRQLLQKLGTEVFRKEVSESLWVDLLMDEYKLAMADPLPLEKPRWLITDVRFKDEADAVNELGGTLVRVVNPSVVSMETHQSETELNTYPYFQYYIDNSGSLADLTFYVKDIMRKEGVI